MKVYFVRHGETEWNREGRWQGSFDIVLSEEGKKQALDASSQFENKPIDAIYSSDLKRAYETAQFISARTGLKNIIRDPRLRERRLGKIEGKTSLEVSQLLSMNINLLDIIGKDLPVDGMEPLKSQFDRASQFINDLRKSDHKNTVVVSHGVTIGIMIEIITGEDFRKRKIGNCEIIEVVV
ncbi:MAG: hypothetical protein AMDU5_GPLC00001G0025 [Thermoplasmatales archaeon Gpl]|nr:MAG: hypothetical protein AMDU5_GPLC00001G0025 [Thermoplasmatales archaeon Gpl]